MTYGYIVLGVLALVLIGAVLVLRRSGGGTGHVRGGSHERYEEARAYSELSRHHHGGGSGGFGF